MKKLLSVLLSVLLLFSVFTFGGCKKTVEGYNFHTELQQKYFSDSPKNTEKYAVGQEELSKPKPYTVKWGKEAGEGPYLITVSVNSDLENAKVYQTTENKLDIKNLLSDTTYYYKIQGTKETKVKSFKVAKCLPRNLDIDGIANARDLGGYTTEQGYKVKQGMIFRSAQFNTAYTDQVSVNITQKGIDTLKNEFGIKTEIDFRKTWEDERGIEVGGLIEEGDGAGVLGDGVNYYQCPWDLWDTTVDATTKQSLKKIFEIFCDEANYPIIFHCAIGTDRTGFVAYAIEELLFMSNKDKEFDYMFSNFAGIGSSRSYSEFINGYPQYIKDLNYDGDRMWAIKKFIAVRCGIEVASAEYWEFLNKLDNIRNIMLVK